MTTILGDQTYIGGLIKDSGFGDIVSSNLIDGIAAGFLAKGFSKKIRGAIALGVAGTETAVEAVAGEGSSVSDIINNSLNAGLTTLVVTKNPYAAVGVAIAAGIYTGLDDEWKARIAGWVKQAVDLFVSAFNAQTWIDAAAVLGSGWESLSSTINGVIDRIISAKNALLEFLGINQKTYIKPSQVSSTAEYTNTSQVIDERIAENTSRLSEIASELATNRYDTQERRALLDEQRILRAELVTLQKDKTDLRTGPSGIYGDFIQSEKYLKKFDLESKAVKAALEGPALLAGIETSRLTRQETYDAINELIDNLSNLDTSRLSDINDELTELGKKRQEALVLRDSAAANGATISTPAGTQYTGMAAYQQGLIEASDSRAQTLLQEQTILQATQDRIQQGIDTLTNSLAEYEASTGEYERAAVRLNAAIANGTSVNNAENTAAVDAFKQNSAKFSAVTVDLTNVSASLARLVEYVNQAKQGLEDSYVPPQAPANRKPGTPFATGGRVFGPGTGTSDSIPALLSNGEFVINAESTKRFLPWLEALNAGRVPRFVTGGLVGAELQAKIDKMDGPSYGSTAAGKAATLAIKVKELNITLPDGYKFETGLDPTSTVQSAALSGLGSGSSMVQGLSLSILEMMGAVSRTGDGTSTDVASNGAGSGKGDGKAAKKKGTFGWYSEQFEKLGKSIDPTILGQMNKAEIESAFATATRIDKLTKERDAMVAGSVQQVKATAELEQLNQQIDSLGQKSTVMQEAFQENFASFLKGQQSFSDMVNGVLDTLTSTIIDKFSEAFTKNLFKSLGLDKFFDNIFNSIFDSIGNAAGGGGKGAIGSAIGSGIGNFIANLGGMGGNWLGGWATGGYIAGPGTGTSDSILARLSNGEYVVNAATTKRWLPFLESINANDGRLPAFASGGLVGPSNPSAFTTTNGNNNDKNKQQVFNINVSGDVSMQTRKEIARMIPEITAGVNMTNRERGSR